jgi:uncharacterized membrane protein
MTNLVALVSFLLSIEAFVLFLSEHKRFRRFFKFVPAVFWIYFLPMVFSTLGIIPSQSPVYQNITAYFLPASLVLLFLGANIPSILKLGKDALIMMLAGSFGIILGAPLVLMLFGRWLPAQAWSGFGALSGSWVGGSANMIAAREALGTPDAVFLPMLVVDVIVSYSWMGILMLLANYQKTYDRWNGANLSLIDELHRKTKASTAEYRGIRWRSTFGMLLLAAGLTIVSILIAGQLPQTKGLSATTWTIMIVSVTAILLSLTKLRKLQSYGASRIGYWLLYFVLTSMGAKANLRDLGSVPLFILAGFVWVIFHFMFMLVVSRFTKSPLSVVATASQANIGGSVSAPIVAAIYEPSLAPVGLLLGVFGNLIGTYAALLCASLCHLVAR